ncbi:MAG: universal stress protein, partial [Planctomycetes bacterium]|nr:universal stress protein [Planctomycetota bacterium]
HRVMVCLSSRSPGSEVLLRKGARLASRLNAPWYAVYIQTPAESVEKVDAATQRRIANTMTLAQQLGGVPLPFKGTDVVSTIEAFVREYGIDHIILGRSRRPWYQRWFGRSVLDRLLQTVRGVDVTIVDSLGKEDSDRHKACIE